MPGGGTNTGPSISRKIPGNKFNRAEFLRQNKHNLEFFAQVDQFNKINREKILADYLNVIINKSIILVNSFCDKFNSKAKHKNSPRLTSDSTIITDSPKRFSVFNANYLPFIMIAEETNG